MQIGIDNAEAIGGNMIFTTKTGAKALGIKQDTLKHYAVQFDVGSQPGGPGTPRLFTQEDLLELRECRAWICEENERNEDREALGLGALYNEDGSPRG